MFNRIRYAIKVLSYRSPELSPYDQPDIVFESESPQETTKLSKTLGSFVEVMLVSVAIGFITGWVYRLMPGKGHTGIATITGIGAALLAFLSQRVIADLDYRLRLKLRIGDKLAPYLGHKILRTVRTLRG
ncbi:MAG TPA: hypothetical protein VN943_10310 [Candidatus Acidoferrum sp.]|nr:hypothetical protein [Candidatus Acidoferrum sp.]